MSWLVTVPAEVWPDFAHGVAEGLAQLAKEVDATPALGGFFGVEDRPHYFHGRVRGAIDTVRRGVEDFRRGRRRPVVCDGLVMEDEFIETYEFTLPDDEALTLLIPCFAVIRGAVIAVPGVKGEVGRHWAHESRWRVTRALEESAVERLARLAAEDGAARLDL